MGGLRLNLGTKKPALKLEKKLQMNLIDFPDQALMEYFNEQNCRQYEDCKSGLRE
jgi:hypothetical protein